MPAVCYFIVCDKRVVRCVSIMK